MEKKPQKAKPAVKRTEKIIPAIAVAATITSCTPEPKVTTPEPVRIYIGDTWEKMYAIKYMKAGKPDYLNAINPSGDMLADFGHYLFGQGGGKSNNLTDSITKQPGCWPPEPDEDGKKYHTVNDITWILYCKLAPIIGYKATSAEFYNMNKERHDSIVQWHIDKGRYCSSDVVNLVCAYAVWGTGSYKSMVNRFFVKFGNVETFLKLKGEYWVFYQMLVCKQEVMERDNPRDWPINGRGWSSGLAHFHRVFKVYCK